MTIDSWFFGLLASVALLAFGFALRFVQDQLTLKNVNKDIKRVSSEFDAFKKHHDETIASIEQRHAAECEELTKRIADLESAALMQRLPSLNKRSHRLA